MPSKQYTVLIADRSTGVTRRFTFSRRTASVLIVFATMSWAVPVLVGLGARWSASDEITRLHASNSALRLANDSYREATGELTTQIGALEGMVNELGERTAPDQAQRKAMANLPALVRNRAVGGASPAATRSLMMAMTAPEDTFGVLRELLGSLQDRLRLVRTDAQRWQALAGATPSIWPVIGWLTGGFGERSDPFTGEAAQHLGLDISADRGQPVYATADGEVESAGYRNDFGNMVVLNHEFGLSTRYAHLSRIIMRAGQRVERGDLVGYVGSTGRSTAPHLHYEVWANGRPINPMKLLTTGRK
jgi:murein DD-endopeptidase MepM/ murein hydrolase activator NlpD